MKRVTIFISIIVCLIFASCNPNPVSHLEKELGAGNAALLKIESYRNASTLNDRVAGWHLKHLVADAAMIRGRLGATRADRSDFAYIMSEASELFDISSIPLTHAFRTRTTKTHLYWIFSSSEDESVLISYQM